MGRKSFIAKLLDDPNKNWTPPTLTTERLLIRPIELTDAESIFKYAKNPKVSRYTLWESHQTLQDSVNFIQDYVFPLYAEREPEAMGIAFKETPDQLIGSVGCFWGSKKSKNMEMGYALSEEHWGKGIMVEAAKAVMDYCFKEFGLKRIQARCKVENLGSARVMEKLGMKFEGTHKSSVLHRGRYWDLHVYAKIALDP